MFKSNLINRRKPLFFALLVGALVSAVSPAFAMGSGNPYQDAQSGLNYVVYQPGYSSGLALKSFTLQPNCSMGKDESVSAVYGSGKKFYTLTETSIKTICPMNMMLIRGATRTVVNKTGAGNLTGTQVSIISVGVPRAELNRIFSSLAPKYKVSTKK